MENMNFNVTPLQVFLALAFQAWIIIFPILILRKLDYLTKRIEALEPESDEGDAV